MKNNKRKGIIILVILGVGLFIYLSWFLLPELNKETYTSDSYEKNRQILEESETPKEEDQTPEANVTGVNQRFISPDSDNFQKTQVNGIAITTENIFNLVNNERIDNELPPLIRNADLDRVAELKLADLKKYKYWSHDNPKTGKTSWDWFQEAGLKTEPKLIAGENLARDYATAQETVDGWINSPSHFANIIQKKFLQTGVATDGDYVVQVFYGN